MVAGQPLAEVLYSPPTQPQGTASSSGDDPTLETEGSCTCGKEKTKASIPPSPTFHKYLLLYQETWTKDQQIYADKMFALWIAGSYIPTSVSKDAGAHRFLAAVNIRVRCLKLIYLIITLNILNSTSFLSLERPALLSTRLAKISWPRCERSSRQPAVSAL